MIIEKELTSLVIGHYVVEIKQQTGKVKLASPSHIKSTTVIKKLSSKGVITVLIDDEKTITGKLVDICEVVGNEPLIQLSTNELTPEKLQQAKKLLTESKTILNKTVVVK